MAERAFSIANYNCPGQIVITGEAAAVAEAGTAIKRSRSKKITST